MTELSIQEFLCLPVRGRSGSLASPLSARRLSLLPFFQLLLLVARDRALRAPVHSPRMDCRRWSCRSRISSSSRGYRSSFLRLAAHGLSPLELSWQDLLFVAWYWPAAVAEDVARPPLRGPSAACTSAARPSGAWLAALCTFGLPLPRLGGVLDAAPLCVRVGVRLLWSETLLEHLGRVPPRVDTHRTVSSPPRRRPPPPTAWPRWRRAWDPWISPPLMSSGEFLSSTTPAPPLRLLCLSPHSSRPLPYPIPVRFMPSLLNMADLRKKD